MSLYYNSPNLINNAEIKYFKINFLNKKYNH